MRGLYAGMTRVNCQWLVITALVCHAATAWATSSIVGFWTASGDQMIAPRAIVQISRHGTRYDGYIKRLYARKSETGYCTRCEGTFKDKPIVGLRFIWGLRRIAPDQWGGGYLMNPITGRTYRCRMTLAPDGEKVNVHIYYGIRFLGRSQTWLRRSISPNDIDLK